MNLQSGQAEYYQFGAPGIPGATGQNGTQAGQQNKLLGSSKVQTSISNLLANPSFDSMVEVEPYAPDGASCTTAWDSTASRSHFAPVLSK